MAVELREARADDVERVFEWRNLPQVVALAATPRRVEWEEHLAWFDHTLRSENRLLFIISEGLDDAGVLRFDRADMETAVISIFLIPAMTGRGFGVDAIRLGCQRAFAAWNISRILAYTRVDNAVAIRAFEKAGFSEPSAADSKLLCLHLRRPIQQPNSAGGGAL